MNKLSHYKQAGVSIDAGNAFVEAIKPLIKKTQRPEVLSGAGGFASLFRLNPQKYQDPVMVACTDGVGTKLKLAQNLDYYEGLGTDLVAMCVNDLLCTGAEPLFFLDYYACGQLEPKKALQVVQGMSDALASIHCALIGGETAEMPGVYQKDEFDLAGFAVGVVDRSKIIDGSDIALGNKIIGLASSGVHSNGFSLVRKIINDHALDLNQQYEGLETSLGMALIEPTKIYVKPVLKLRQEFPILGIAHITGGGLLENIPRILPASTQAQIDRQAWKKPAIFDFLQKQGNLPDEEMDRVFNTGIGLTMIVPEEASQEICERLTASGYPAWIIGEIVARANESEAQVCIR